ncbi:hypothetical protein SLS56_005442 [Neofusicoccum ribis]|uniref:FAD/NAD(P)-binding domain-containing protein n=1 Tax=Neofusicoccum ribis TaxID=45134 RepID=A0ABR3STD5_9PEZI
MTLLKRARLILGMLAYALSLLTDTLSRSLARPLHRLTRKPLPPSAPRKTVLVVGASFAGHHAATLLAPALPPSHRLVVVEPRDRFFFTWIFPRLAVVPGHEAKGFIPYGGLLRGEGVEWRRGEVERVVRGGVVLVGGEAVEAEFVVLATGAVARGPPAGLGVVGKGEGMRVLRGVQVGVERAVGPVVVVGGGAVGVEVAADVKGRWPGKRVVLVHSRAEVLGRFGRELRACVMEALGELGVEFVLGEKVVGEVDGVVTLTSGRTLECGYLVGLDGLRSLEIDCTGHKPASGILAELSPSSIAESGHIKVKPTMQIVDESFPNIYAAGDVAETGTQRANARTSMSQATVAVDNILLAIKGKSPRHQYKPLWQEDGETELLFKSKTKDVTLHAASGWKHMGIKPYVDDYEDKTEVD